MYGLIAPLVIKKITAKEHLFVERTASGVESLVSTRQTGCKAQSLVSELIHFN